MKERKCHYSEHLLTFYSVSLPLLVIDWNVNIAEHF